MNKTITGCKTNYKTKMSTEKDNNTFVAYIRASEILKME